MSGLKIYATYYSLISRFSLINVVSSVVHFQDPIPGLFYWTYERENLFLIVTLLLI